MLEIILFLLIATFAAFGLFCLGFFVAKDIYEPKTKKEETKDQEDNQPPLPVGRTDRTVADILTERIEELEAMPIVLNPYYGGIQRWHSNV